MIKEAIEKIESMSRNNYVKEIDGVNYLIHDGACMQIKPDLEFTETVTLTSLDAIVKMLKIEAITLGKLPVFVEVTDHGTVAAFTKPQEQLRNQREFYYKAKATDVPGWDAETTMSFENAMIALRTRFQPTPDVEYALKLLNDLTTGSKVTYNDNGIATSVVTKTGVALQSSQNIKPIIRLKPYRTFQEVDQPESEFLIRITDRGIKFIEADGGMWKLRARDTVAAWLSDRLAKEIKDGSIVVML